ncbi:hypothetical protein PRUPE_1G196600 [Prunus persica]|uniref:Uncharacterized protein n=1 Tax=Prunus persica TaxID=3760 RepID=A0A251R025_PRUPE|nr:hypothetical protein PRUPE_1G196600 [Prunus persica]
MLVFMNPHIIAALFFKDRYFVLFLLGSYLLAFVGGLEQLCLDNVIVPFLTMTCDQLLFILLLFFALFYYHVGFLSPFFPS